MLDLLITRQTKGIQLTALNRKTSNERDTHGTEQTLPEEVTAAYTDHHREPYLQRQRDATVDALAAPLREEQAAVTGETIAWCTKEARRCGRGLSLLVRHGRAQPHAVSR